MKDQKAFAMVLCKERLWPGYSSVVLVEQEDDFNFMICAVAQWT